MFKVSFESVGVVSSRRLADYVVGDELSTDFCDGYNDVVIPEKSLPVGVASLMGGHVSEDDGQGDSDIKVFVSFDLMVNAKDLKEAENFEPPVNLLTKLTDVIASYDIDGEAQMVIQLEGEWSVSNTEEISKDDLDTVSSGSFVGRVIKIAGGIVTQKTGREDTDVVRHLESRLSEVVVEGDMVDIDYVGETGVVGGRAVVMGGVGR